MTKLSSIEFSIEDHGVEFSFLSDGEPGQAMLQLPRTGDSEDTINGQEYDTDNDDHKLISGELRKFYMESFNCDVDLAAASALVGEILEKVVEVDGFYVAFGSKEYILVESRYKDYYNKAALFEFAEHSNRDYDATDLIEKARAML